MSADPGSGSGAIAIRPATSADAGALAEVGARLFEQTFGAANEPANMTTYLAGAFSEPIQRAELTDPARSAWIARDPDGRTVGYAMVRRDSTIECVQFHSPTELERIYVDRAWHGRGLGDALMETCIRRARGWNAGGIWLAVWEKNARAISFYTRSGFKIAGATTFELGHETQSDLVMARRFAD